MRRRPVLTIVIMAALVRLVLLATAWHAPQRLLTPDSYEYAALARTLGEDGVFARGERPEIFRTPGYPLFLLIGTLFGSAGVVTVAIVQIVADVVTVYLTYLLALLVADRRAALWAAGWQAVCVVAVVSSVRILSDAPYTCLLMLALCLLAVHLKTGRWWSLLAAAGVIAAACYVRPVGLAMAAVMGLSLLPRPKRWRRLAAFAGVVVVLLAPWVIRNRIVADYTGFSTFATDSMYYFAVPALTAERKGTDAAAERAWQRRHGASAERNAGLSPGRAAAWRARRARQAIAEHPWAYTRLHLRGCAGVYLPAAPSLLEIAGRTTGQRGTRAVLRREGLAAAVRHYFGGDTVALLLAAPLVALLGLKYAAVAIGAAGRLFARPTGRGRLRLPAEAWLLIGVVLVGTLLPGPFGLPRYRVPLGPILSIAAGCGIAALTRRLRRRTN
ncbi:MAG: glycosyltransferase family 39 protein [Phycisphaerae bacterium]|nr:glycosyltransferase family 39 protein [Phycisphaerae bacterium]